MNVLVLQPQSNSSGRHDVTGAFAPGAREFCRLYGVDAPRIFDNTLEDAEREAQVLGLIRAAPRPLDIFAYFGHGIDDGLSSAGFTGPADASQLAAALNEVAGPTLTTLLYACSAANSFAGRLAQLVTGQPRVFGHTTVAHTFRNPHLKEFPPGDWVIAPTDPQWTRWRQRLHDTHLWATFPFLTEEQLREVLDVEVGEVDTFLGLETQSARHRSHRRRSEEHGHHRHRAAASASPSTPGPVGTESSARAATVRVTNEQNPAHVGLRVPGSLE